MVTGAAAGNVNVRPVLIRNRAGPAPHYLRPRGGHRKHFSVFGIATASLSFAKPIPSLISPLISVYSGHPAGGERDLVLPHMPERVVAERLCLSQVEVDEVLTPVSR